MKDETIIEKAIRKHTDDDQRIGLVVGDAMLEAVTLARKDEKLKTLSIIHRRPCPHCNGTGFVEVDEK